MQNLLDLEQKTDLTREELINVYTMFVSMFVLQENDKVVTMKNATQKV
jgi:hypothetical protein